MKLLSVGPAESVPVLSQPVREFDGQHLGDVWRTLRRNLEGSPQAFVTLVGALPPPLEVEIATAGESQVVAVECLEDVRTLLGAGSFAIRASYASQDPMVRTPALVEQAATLFRAGSHVGFVGLPSGLTISVTPKIAVDTLFALLARVYDRTREAFREEVQGYRTVEDLFEFVAEAFVGHVEELLARGIRRGYEEIEQPLTVPRGRILIEQTLRRQPATTLIHFCRHARFTGDVLENRILRVAVAALRGHGFSRELGGRLRRVETRLAVGCLTEPEVGRVDVHSWFESLEFSRLNEHYRPALALARLILDGLVFSGQEGHTHFRAFLVDMNWLFEECVASVCRDAARLGGLAVRQKPPFALDEARALKAYPDVLLERDGAPAMVVDAKYKLAATTGDVHQMVAYCHAAGVRRALLVHPDTEVPHRDHLRITGPGAFVISYLAIPLQGGPRELESNLAMAAGQVLRVEKQGALDADGRPR